MVGPILALIASRPSWDGLPFPARAVCCTDATICLPDCAGGLAVDLMAVGFGGLAANLEEPDVFSIAKTGAASDSAVGDSRSAGVSGVSAGAAGTGAGP